MFLANSETGVIEDANHAATRLILRPLDELIGMHFTGLHPPEMVAKTRQHFEIHLKQAMDAGNSSRLNTMRFGRWDSGAGRGHGDDPRFW